MHDFCFSPLYAGLLLLGAFAGYASGSSTSLVAGGGSAAVVGLCAYISMQVYLKSHKKCVPTVLVSLVVAAAVTGKMGQSFLKDPRTHIPQGFLFMSSGTMVLYYLWNLACFRVAPKPTKKAK